MTSYNQETDSKKTQRLPRHFEYSASGTFSNQTYGGDSILDSISIPSSSDFMQGSWQFIRNIEATEHSEQSKELFSALQDIVSKSIDINIEVRDFPKFHSYYIGEDSIIYEWIFDNYRVGFSIEIDEDESSWFVVTDKDLGDIRATGLLTHRDIQTLLHELIHFVLFRT